MSDFAFCLLPSQWRWGWWTAPEDAGLNRRWLCLGPVAICFEK